MKKLITAVLTLALLAALTGASASEAGTSSDPLVTKEYADTVYTQAVLDACLERIEAALSGFNTVLDMLAEGGDTLVYTQGREAFLSVDGGGTLSMGLGGSFILTSGKVTVTFDSGEVIDTSTGKSVASGASLKPLTRYFVTEDMLALFTAASAAQFFLDGPYSAGPGVYKQYAQYEDVQGGEWFSDAARYSYEKRLFRDWNAPLFRPQEAATRADMIYALWVSAGCPKTDFVSPFVDLTEDWYIPAVNWAYEHGITNGSDAVDRFVPNGLLSRQQIVTMFYRWAADLGADVSGRADLTVFPDYASIHVWAAEGASWAAHAGLIFGYEDSTFRPQGDISRAEAAIIIGRFEPLIKAAG